MSYLESLSAELSRVGIRGRLRRRILAEIGDHLESDPEAALGAPAELATHFADELGTARARRAGFATFGSLAVAGIAFAAAFVAFGPVGAGPARGYASSRVLGNLALVLAVVGAQVAFAAGTLAAARALHRRRDHVVSRAEAVVIGRRAAVALAAGLASMTGLALIAVEFHRGVDAWWPPMAIACAAVGACALAPAVPAVAAALRLRPTGGGAAGDIFDDIGSFVPPVLRGRPWSLALLLALAIAVVLSALGVAADDPYDGALRGIGDGLACLAGFAVLGRYLGLRPAPEQ